MNNIVITDVRANPGDSAFLVDDGKDIYPIDAMELNTGIMIDLVIKECAKDFT